MALAGCGGGGDNTSAVTIDGVSTTTSVDRTDLYNLTIESDVTVKTFNATGVSGNAHVPIGSGIGLDSDSGIGNDLIEYSK